MLWRILLPAMLIVSSCSGPVPDRDLTPAQRATLARERYSVDPNAESNPYQEDYNRTPAPQPR